MTTVSLNSKSKKEKNDNSVTNFVDIQQKNYDNRMKMTHANDNSVTNLKLNKKQQKMFL